MRPRSRSLAGGVLLRRDVAPDAPRPLAEALRRLDDDRHRHPVGAHVDLHVFVGGAQADLSLDEGASGGDAEGGDEVDHVGHLRELRQLGPHLEGHPRQALHHQIGKALDRLGDDGKAQQPTHRRRRDPAIDGPRPAFLRVDVPAGAPFEPGAAGGGEPPRVAVPLERGADQDLRSVLGELEVEARTQGLVAEAQLHHLRLDDDPTPLEKRQEIAGVLAADVDPHAARPLILEPGEEPHRVAIGRRVLILTEQQRGRQEGLSRLGIEQGDGERPAGPAAGVADRPDLQPVLDLLGRRRHRFGEPGVDAVGSHRPEEARVVRRRLVLSSASSAPAFHRPGARPLATPPLALHARDVHGAAVHGVVHAVRGGLRLGRRPGLSPSGLVAQRDQESSHMLAVPAIAGSESRASAGRIETGRREVDRDLVGVGVGAAHVAPGGPVLDGDVVHRVPANVVVTAKIRSRAEEAAEGAVVEGGECFGER